MKQLVQTYSFNPATRQVTLIDFSSPLQLEDILLITNVTDNVMIYNFADSSCAGTTISGNIITLAYDTTAMSSTDALQIWVDVQDIRDMMPHPVVIDDTQPFRVSGQGADGLVRPVLVGADGGMQMTDCPGTIIATMLGTAVNAVSDKIIDTKGFNSISVALSGTIGTGAIICQQADESGNWNNVMGWLASGGSANINNMYSAGLYVFPCISRFVRFLVGTATTGAMVLRCALRSEPMPLMWASNVRGWAAQGQSTNLSNPVDVAGWDGSAIRRLMTDTTGNALVKGADRHAVATGSQVLTVGGADPSAITRRLSTDASGVLQVNDIQAQSDATAPSMRELLMLILHELRVLNILIHETPNALNQGRGLNAEALLTVDPSTDFIS